MVPLCPGPHCADAGAALFAGDFDADGALAPPALDQVFHCQYRCGALALVFLLCPDPLYPHALGIRLPIAGKVGGLSFAAVDKTVVCADGAAPAARFNKRSASAGVFLSVRHFVGRRVPL